MTIARPFVKWAGGKTALLPEILERLPEKIGTYYEPFIGAGAVFFALAAEKRFKYATIGDANRDLIRTYLAISRDVAEVVHFLEKHVYEEKHYYAMRAKDPEKMPFAAAAARFIYLNKTCFNGLYRVNRKGQFNVPFGDYVNPTICDDANLCAVASALRSVKLTVGAHDFEALIDNGEPRRGDAVYFDPPYAPVSKTSNFTAYAKGGFGDSEQERLRDCFARLDKKGVHVLLSNSDTPLVRKLYKGFKIEKVQVRRAINSKAAKRGEVGELLISGKRSK